MKKLFSSALSVLTSAALISGSALSYAVADDSVTVDIDLSQEILYLDEIDDLSLSLGPAPSVLSNYSDSAYNYRDFLDNNNKAVYDALSSLVTPTDTKIEVTLPQRISVVVSAMPGSSKFSEADQQAYQDAIIENCRPAIDSVTFDMPEICWLDMTKFGIGVGNDTTISRGVFSGKYTIYIKSLVFTTNWLPAMDSLSSVNEYVRKLNTATEEFPVEGNTRYEQLKSIHDYIAEFTYYDTNADFASSALGSLVEPGVVCEGYAKGFKLMCDKLDIPCILIFGNYNEATQTAHMWDYVQMEDGKWYAVDVTWDDLDNEDVLKYDFFLKGSESFNKRHTPEIYYNITKLNYPELSVSDYDPTAQITTTTTTTTTTSTTTSTTATTSVTTSKTETTSKASTTTSTTGLTTTTKAPTTTSITKLTATTTSAPVYQTGDVNHDGAVNIADLVFCHSTVSGKLNPEYLCDVNGDGKENSFDISLLRQILLK